MVSVSAVVGKGQALSDVVKLCNEAIEETDIPSEIMTKIAGSYETQQEMFGDLTTLLILIIILVYIVMASQFENLMKPFVIMFSIPFTFTGVFLGLWSTGTALSAMAFIGILILMGIVVKNGIVLIDYTTLLEERGVDVKEATVQAARSRLRPILMTTLTTVLGMLPMALGRGEGAEMWNGLGTTVAWGLSVSTLITLLLIPALYCSLETRAVKRNKKKAEKEAKKREEEVKINRLKEEKESEMEARRIAEEERLAKLREENENEILAQKKPMKKSLIKRSLNHRKEIN